MIVKCEECPKYYDDEFRDTTCPHNTFLANDGQNNFKHYPEAWLSDKHPDNAQNAIPLGESTSYQNWLNENEIKKL